MLIMDLKVSDFSKNEHKIISTLTINFVNI